MGFSSTSGHDVWVNPWFGTSPFTVTATNACGSFSAYFYPVSTGFRMAANKSTVYPNIARDFVRISLNNTEDWSRLVAVRIIDSGSGEVSYSEKMIDRNRLGQNKALQIDLKDLAKGKYIVEIQYLDSRDSHHLIVE